MSKEQDAIFVRHTGIVLLVLVAFAIIVGIIANILQARFTESQITETMLAARIAPVGRINLGTEPLSVAATEPAPAAPAPPGAAAETAPAADLGREVYDKICFACHTQGVAGAPKIGDAPAWTDRLAMGTEMLVKKAIDGFQGSAGLMPPRGGMASLSDEEVRASVLYMLETLDGEPAAAAEAEAAPVAAAETAPETAPLAAAAEPDVAGGPAPPPEPETAAETASPPAAEPEPAPVAAAAGSDLARGKEVYDAACFVCHTTGAAGAPKFGDAPAWSERIASGIDVLYDHAVNGFMGKTGLMPPKGGRPDFSDADVKAAVDYMIDKSR